MSVVMDATLGQFFFKAWKELRIFQAKKLAQGDYPGKLEWLAVNNLVYFRGILAGPVILIVSWAIEK